MQKERKIEGVGPALLKGQFYSYWKEGYFPQNLAFMIFPYGCYVVTMRLLNRMNPGLFPAFRILK